MIYKKVERDYNIELLRIVSMFLIVIVHCAITTDSFSSCKTYIGLAQLAFASAVNTFIFISGYYGIKFKLRTLFSLLLQGVFLAVILYLVSCFILNKSSFSWIQLIQYFFPVSSHIWWFFSAYFMLFILSPIINKGFDSLSNLQAIIIVGLILYFNTNTVLLGCNIFSFFGNSLFQCLTIYLIARLCKRINFNIPKAKYIYPATLLITWSLMLLSIYTSHDIFAIRLIQHNNPFSIINGILLFYVFKNISIKKSVLISKIAPLTFGIYLVHEFTPIREIRMDFINQYISTTNNPFMIICFIIGISILTYSISAAVEKVRQIICNPIVDKIDKNIFQKINI